MKFLKSIVVLNILLINTYAQNNSSVKQSYPLKLKIGAGISFPTSLKKTDFDAAFSPGFHLLVSKQINVKSEVYTGLNLNGIGVRNTVPYIKYESYYASFPLMYKYEISTNLFVEGGVQHNLPFFSRFSKLNGDNASGKETTIEKSSSKQLTFINGGVSVKMNELISFRLLYGYPISPYQNFSFKIDTTSYNYSFKNNQLQFQITYTIPPIEKQKNEREISQILINELKTGSLLVMLPPNSLIQENLIKNGKVDDAKLIEDKINIYLKSLIKLSRYKFDFCNILFFMPDKLEQIKNHNYSNCFVDENLLISQELSIPNDTKTMIAHIYFSETGLNNFYQKFSEEIYINYIQLKDAEDFKVASPFPNEIYVDVNTKNISKNAEYTLEKLNYSLNKFYLKKNR